MLFLPREEGQGTAQYGILALLFALIALGFFYLIGPLIGNTFSTPAP